MRPSLFAAVCLLGAAIPHGVSGMETPGNPADAAFAGAMDAMMMGMQETKPTGNTDVDFARMMLPHHQAAVDMAKAEMRYGTDPELKRLATDIVLAQDKEIAQMKTWLTLHAKAP